jgi:hypothetical protein
MASVTFNVEGAGFFITVFRPNQFEDCIYKWFCLDNCIVLSYYLILSRSKCKRTWRMVCYG